MYIQFDKRRKAKMTLTKEEFEAAHNNIMTKKHEKLLNKIY